jgi:cell division protein FtsB
MHTTTPPPPPPPQQQAEEKKGDGFLTAVTKHWLPFLTAILVLATAALGLYSKQVADQRDEAEAGSSELEAEKAELQQEIADLEEQKAGLEQELAQAQVTTTTTDGDTTSTTLDPTPEVLRQTGGAPVTIAFASGIDLDTDADNWGVNESGTDVYASGGPSISGSQFSLVTEPPTPVTCAASTLPVSSLTSAQTVVGQQFCVHTDEERWAYVRIAAIDTEARTISFDVTVWKLASDP